jgi:hypothetical protein
MKRANGGVGGDALSLGGRSMAGWTYPTPYTLISEFAPVKTIAAVDGSTRE